MRVVLTCLMFVVVCASVGWGQPAGSISLEVLEPDQRTQPIRDFPVSVGLVF